MYCPHCKEGCEWIGQLRAFETHQTSLNGCNYEKILCPNKCTDSNLGSLMMHNYFYRKDLKDHLANQCIKLVDCPFTEAGCKERVCRGQLDDHMTSSIQVHLVMLMGAYKEVKRRLEDLRVLANPNLRKPK